MSIQKIIHSSSERKNFFYLAGGRVASEAVRAMVSRFLLLVFGGTIQRVSNVGYKSKRKFA